MESQSVNRLLSALDTLSDATNPDFTIRQLRILLLIAREGDAGTTPTVLQKRTGSTQSAVSRTIKLLDKHGDGYAFTENALDPHDNRARIVRLIPKGERLLNRMFTQLHKE